MSVLVSVCVFRQKISFDHLCTLLTCVIIIIIIIIIQDIDIAQVRTGHKCAMLAEMAVWLRN